METSLAVLSAHQWAIDPGSLVLLEDIYTRRIVQGIRLTPEDLKALKWDVPLVQTFAVGDLSDDALKALMADGWSAEEISALSGEMQFDAAAGSAPPAPPGKRKIAVINLAGVVQQKQNLGLSGPNGASAETFANAVEAAVEDPSVAAVVGNFDSPGGSVFGIQEAADKIRGLQGQKPMIAQVNSLCASAAYWLATAFPKINITPGGQAGSIGVYTMHNDISGKMAAAGEKPTFISAGKYKVEGHQFAPLDSDAAKAMQRVVDGYYSAFTSAVAKGRGVDQQAVIDGYGQGRTLGAKDAVREGVADKISTLDQTLRSLGSPAGQKSAMRAESNDNLHAFGGSAAAFLPEMTDEQRARAGQVQFAKTREGGKTVDRTMQCPDEAIFSLSLLANGKLGDSKVGAGKIYVAFGEAKAIYAMKSIDRDGDSVFCNLISSEIPGNEPKVATETGKSDEWRRRRYESLKRRRVS